MSNACKIWIKKGRGEPWQEHDPNGELVALRAKVERLERENALLRAYAFEMASAMRIAGDSGSASGEALARAECAQLRLVIAKLNADIASAWAKNGGAL